MKMPRKVAACAFVAMVTVAIFQPMEAQPTTPALRLQRLERVTTRAGARTGLWVPSQSRLYVAVPARGGGSAEIRVFEADTARR